MAALPSSPPGAPASLVILGGGTAGWIAACLLARAWPATAITVLEAPDVPIVGVGEGSTPQLAGFMRRIGLAEADWMPAANATYKLGIEFAGWSTRPGFERYFHPFASAVDLHTEPAFHAAHSERRRGWDVPAHPDAFFLASWLAAHDRGPFADDRFPFAVGYGYHFDAHRIGAVLRDHAVRSGVRHLPARVAHVEVRPDGTVAHLAFDGGDTLAADLFVDASGFRALIAGEALGGRFIPFADNLFNDRAVVMPTPPSPQGPRPSTRATALSAGWAWDIPLRHRTGNGYVYSSRYLSDDAAEKELRAHLGLLDADVPARRLRMKVGRLADSWSGNCLAIGLAQGFLEPLEATALHLVIATVEQFVDAYAGTEADRPDRRLAFNRAIARRYEGIRDYIVAHYRLGSRQDTAYWRDNAANDRLSDGLKQLFTAWFTGRDLVEEIAHQDIADCYAPLSWGCIFAGYGAFPDEHRLRPAPVRPPMPAADFLARCGANFASHRSALATLGGVVRGK